MSAAAVAVLATLDTKAEEADHVRMRLLEHGLRPVLVDIGTAGTPGLAADVTRDRLAADHGGTKQEAMEAVAAGAGRVLGELLSRGELAGAFGLGGGQGTWIAATALRTLPLGLPKVLVSTVAARAPFHVRDSDIVLVPSITDIAGLNRILAGVLSRSVAALAGMIGARSDAGGDPLVAMTMFGVTTAGGEHVRRALAAAGREVAVFHANGNGGRTLERLIRTGQVSGVLDWTTTEITDEVVGGIATAGPHRLEAAGEAGLPQLVVPGAVDVVNFGGPETVPARFSGRTLHQHTPVATLMRTSADEAYEIGRVMAGALARARGPVRVLIPDGGFSALDAPGQPFADPAADKAFVAGLSSALPAAVAVEHSAHHINDARFADLAARRFLDLASAGGPDT